MTLEEMIKTLPPHKLNQIEKIKSYGLSLKDITPILEKENITFTFLYNGNYDYSIGYNCLESFILGLEIQPIKKPIYKAEFSHGIQSSEATRKQYSELVKLGLIK